MMSSLLEKAIVDATALKEAALKNAENSVIEKYADEIKEAVDTLLEQPEEDPFADIEEPVEEPKKKAVKKSTAAPKEDSDDLSSLIEKWDDDED